MSSSLVFTKSPNGGGFGAFISGFGDVESAQEDLDDAGGDEKVVAVVALDGSDPGISALSAVIHLAIEAMRPAGATVPAENLMLEIFMVGRKSAGAQD